MKQLAITLTLFSVAALTAVGQQSTSTNTSRSNVKNNIEVVPGPGGKARCTSSASGKAAPCTASEVASLNAALSARYKVIKGGIPANSVKSNVVAKDGTLMCVTASGTASCTSANLTDLKQADARVNSKLDNATMKSPAESAK